jgi:hypothetical protein
MPGCKSEELAFVQISVMACQAADAALSASLDQVAVGAGRHGDDSLHRVQAGMAGEDAGVGDEQAGSGEAEDPVSPVILESGQAEEPGDWLATQRWPPAAGPGCGRHGPACGRSSGPIGTVA